ncbi:MAG: hypothetical protein ACO2ZD_00655, partial [Pseudomonadales bacterium]
MATIIPTVDDFHPDHFGCRDGKIVINCAAVNACVNQSQVSVGISGDPEAIVITNAYTPDPDCTSATAPTATQTITSVDGTVVYSGPTAVPVNSSQTLDFTSAPYAPERVFLVSTVVTDDCGTTSSTDVFTIDAATIGDATVNVTLDGPPEATEVTTTYIPHPDCIDPGTPVANREIWDSTFTTLLSGPDPVTVNGTDLVDFTPFAPATQFIVCTKVIDNCGVVNNCEPVTVNKRIPVQDDGGTQLTCTGSPESTDLAGYTFAGQAYTSYTGLAIAVALSNTTTTGVELLCEGGLLVALVNGESDLTAVTLVANKTLPINDDSGNPVACTGDQQTDLQEYEYFGTTYTSYASLAAAIVANDPNIGMASVICNPVTGLLEVVVDGASPATEVVLVDVYETYPINSAPGGPALGCTGVDEAADLDGYTYNGQTYTTYAALEAAIVANEAGVTVATVSCNTTTGELEVTVNDDAPISEIVMPADQTLPIVDGPGGTPLACTGDQTADLAPYIYYGVVYTTYAALAAAIEINEAGVTEAQVVCNTTTGELEVIVNGDAPETEIVMGLEDTAPSAGVNVPLGQDYDAVTINLSYNPNPNCATPGITDGTLVVKDTLGNVLDTVTGVTSSSYNYDFTALINGGDVANASPADFNFQLCYTVVEACGESR